MSATIIANSVTALISIAMELAKSAKMEKDEIDAAYQASFDKFYGKDPASHPHPDFDESIGDEPS